MKTFYSILSAMVAVVLFAPLAVADPGTTWDQQINKSGRFKVLSQFKDEAVLDKETGRVWQRSPTTQEANWFDALTQCYGSATGGRMGWRLPTIEELMSLLDLNSVDGLPPGHPFNRERPDFWSATSIAEDTAWAWSVNFSLDGVLNPREKAGIKEFVWCVRGGQGIDGL